MPVETISPEQLAAMWVKAQPHVGAFISSLVRNFHDADDILQNVAAIVVRKREEYDTRKPFDGWVINIAKLEVLKYRRTAARDRHQFSQQVLEELASTFEQESSFTDDRREALAHCLGEVSGNPRRAIRLRYFEGIKPAEIGRRLGMSANSASVMLHRTRKALHDCVARRLRRAEGRG